jgi:hypothetical protein
MVTEELDNPSDGIRIQDPNNFRTAPAQFLGKRKAPHCVPSTMMGT